MNSKISSGPAAISRVALTTRVTSAWLVMSPSNQPAGRIIVAGGEASMGFYGEQVLPRLLSAACGTKTAEPLRRRVCGGLAGEVVEIGVGSGHNEPIHPEGGARG